MYPRPPLGTSQKLGLRERDKNGQVPNLAPPSAVEMQKERKTEMAVNS